MQATATASADRDAPPATGALLQRLRGATREVHDALEATAVSRAIVAERIDRATYAAVLAQHLHLHHRFERRAPALWLHGGSRADDIATDLEVLGEPASTQPTVATERLLDALDAMGEDELLGAHYVLEGSRKGSAVVSRHLVAALGLSVESGGGLDYHVRRAPQLGRDFGLLCRWLDDAAADARRADAVVAGALALMRGLQAIYEALEQS